MEPVEEARLTKRRPRVYVVADSGHAYYKASDRGDLVYLYDGKVNVFASDRLVKEIEEKLADSTKDDFIILSGNQLAAAITFEIMLSLHGKVNVLIYSHKFEIYELRTIHASQFKSCRVP